MREFRTARLMRGQTIRTRADMQRIQIERDTSTEIGRIALVCAWRATRWAYWILTMLIWFCLYVPAVGISVAAVLALRIVAGQNPAGVLAIVVTLGMFGWQRWHPETFNRCMTSRIDRFGRRLRYRWVWDDLMAAVGVSARDASHRIAVPRLIWVRLGHHVDRLTVQLCPGVTRDDLAERFDALRSEFRALEVRIGTHPHRRGWAQLHVVITDPLTEAPADDPTAKVDLSALPVGRREDGRPWLLGIRDRHLLLCGATGAGKSNLVAATMRALAPAIHAGWVRVIGIDPKGGMEFGMYSELFTTLACESEAEMVATLEDAAAQCTDRTKGLRGKFRRLTPSVQRPFTVC